uniref:Protein kinase domain-containing protein n=1 Tax=Macrostomum lignano TaxID=282301 RepID=A0A1I8FQU2_9PLAT
MSQQFCMIDSRSSISRRPGSSCPASRGSLAALMPNILRQRREALHSMVQILNDSSANKRITRRDQFPGLDVNPSRLTSASTSTATHASAVEGAADTGGGKEEENIDLGAKENRNDFAFLKVIRQGLFRQGVSGKAQVRRSKFFAVKVLQKEQIKKRNEVKHIMSEAERPGPQHRNSVFYARCTCPSGLRTSCTLCWTTSMAESCSSIFNASAASRSQRARFLCCRDRLRQSATCTPESNHLPPENILLDSEGHVRLTDFGLCKEGLNTKSTTSTFCGTPEYLAPEVLRKEPYDMAVDWWCLGSVLYEMLFGLPPFYSREKSEMYSNILHKPLQLKPSASSARRRTFST